MDDWKKGFVDRLNQAQGQWSRRFDETLDQAIMPAFEEIAAFVRNLGFRVSTPMRQDGRGSFKFELAENAYLLLIFRSTGIGEFELRGECFVPGAEPATNRAIGRVADVSQPWARQQFQKGLDSLISCLGGKAPEKPRELVEV